jgi:hypothetical protein
MSMGFRATKCPINTATTRQLWKTRVLKELAQLYPDVNPLWREWVYDVCANTPTDQLEEMKRRIAVNPGKHANPPGGVLHTA